MLPTPPDSDVGAAPCSPTAEEIRVLAYHKWLAAGCPSGDGQDFWLEAERELTRDASPSTN